MSMTATAAPMMIHAVATAPASSFRARAVSPLLTQKSKSVLRTARAIGVVRAASNPNGKSGVESAAQGMGYDTDEGLFGFTPFAEVRPRQPTTTRNDQPANDNPQSTTFRLTPLRCRQLKTLHPIPFNPPPEILNCRPSTLNPQP